MVALLDYYSINNLTIHFLLLVDVLVNTVLFTKIILKSKRWKNVTIASNREKEVRFLLNSKENKMKNILNNWNFMRILRLVMAIFIIFQGIETAQWLFVVAGVIFVLM